MFVSKREHQTRGQLKRFTEDITRLWYQDVILKGDGETASVQVLAHVKHAREAPSIIHNSPAYEPQAN